MSRRSCDAVLCDPDIEIVLPECFCNRLCSRDVDRDLLDWVTKLIENVAVGATVCDRKHLRAHTCRIERRDECHSLIRRCQHHARTVSPPDLADFSLKPEPATAHLGFYEPCKLNRRIDVRCKLLSGILAVEIEEM